MKNHNYVIWDRFGKEFTCVAVGHRIEGTTLYCIEDDGTEHAFFHFEKFKPEEIGDDPVDPILV